MSTYKYPFRKATNITSLSQASRNSAKPVAYKPFGPDMAEHIFDSHYYEPSEACSSEDDYYPKSELDDRDLFDGELQSFHYAYQGELEIETQAELESRLRNRIQKFEKSYNVMCHHALKWFYLMEEVENNPQLKKMFNDIQLMRKLGGSNYV